MASYDLAALAEMYGSVGDAQAIRDAMADFDAVAQSAYHRRLARGGGDRAEHRLEAATEDAETIDLLKVSWQRVCLLVNAALANAPPEQREAVMTGFTADRFTVAQHAAEARRAFYSGVSGKVSIS